MGLEVVPRAENLAQVRMPYLDYLALGGTAHQSTTPYRICRFSFSPKEDWTVGTETTYIITGYDDNVFSFISPGLRRLVSVVSAL